MSVVPTTAVSVLGGASATEISRAEAQCPTVWPEELRAFFSVQGGQSSADAGEVIPLHQLLSLEAAMQVRSELVSAVPPEAGASSGVAGEVVYHYAPAYIPVAESDGNYLFCDTREGPRRGQLGVFSPDAADEDNDWSPSLPDLIVEITTALTHGGTVRWFSPTPVDGKLLWEISDESAQYRAEHDALHAHFLEHPEGFVSPVPIDPTDGLDLMNVQRAVIQMAADAYGHENLTQIAMATEHLPIVVGYQTACYVAVRGVLRGYNITVTGTDGSFSIDPPPYR